MAWEGGRLLPQPHSWALAQCSSTWSTTSGNSTTPSQGLTSHLSWRAPHLLRPRRDSLWGARGDVQHPLHFITVDRTDSTALAMRLHRYLQPYCSLVPPCCHLCLLVHSGGHCCLLPIHTKQESQEKGPSRSGTAHPPLQGVGVTAEQKHYTTVHSALRSRRGRLA